MGKGVWQENLFLKALFLLAQRGHKLCGRNNDRVLLGERMKGIERKAGGEGQRMGGLRASECQGATRAGYCQGQTC